MQVNKFGIWIKNNLFSLCGIAVLVVWGVIFHYRTPVTPIYVNEWAPTYLPWMGVISLLCLAIPVILYVCSREYREQRWTQQVVLLSIAMMLGAIIHRPRVFLDVQNLFFICTLVAFFCDRPLRVHRPPLFYFAFWIYFIWQAITMLWTTNISEAMIYFNRLVPVAAYPIAFWLIHMDDRSYRSLILLFWRVTCIGCILSLVCWMYEMQRMNLNISEFLTFGKHTFNNIFAFDILYAWSGNEHPTFNALWLLGGLACSFFLVDKKRLSLFEAAISWLLVIAVIYLSQSRVGLVTYTVVGASGILYLLRHRRALFYTTLAAMVLGAIIIAVTQIDGIRAFYADPTRDGLMQVTTDYLRIDPWKGCGIGGTTFDYISSVIGYEFKSWWPWWDNVSMYPHNQFLGDWVQAGIVGLVLMCLNMVSLFYECYRQRSFLAFIFCVAVLIIMQIEMPLHILSGSTIIAFLTCFFLCRHLPNDR